MNGQQFYRDRMSLPNKNIRKSRLSLRRANFCTGTNLTLRSSFYRIKVFKWKTKRSILIGNSSNTWTGRIKKRSNKKNRKGLNFAIWPKLVYINRLLRNSYKSSNKGWWNDKNKKNFETVFYSSKKEKDNGVCKNGCKNKLNKILII